MSEQKRRALDFRSVRGLDTETIDGFARLLSLEGRGSFRVESFGHVVNYLFCFDTDLYIAFNLDYNVSAIVKYLPQRTKSLLFEAVPVAWRNATIKYIPAKRLSITIGRRTIRIYDALQFFGCSLRTAAKKYLGKDKLDYDVKDLKEEDFSNPDFIKYADVDANLAGELFRWLLAQAPEEFSFVEPLSAGYWSYRYFREEIISNLPTKRFNWISRRSFRGGRFECFKRGTFRDVYSYDIRSAYPDQLRKLPGIAPESDYREGLFPKMPLGVLCCDLKIPANVHIGPVQVRLSTGLSCCPVGYLKEVWITEPEYRRLAKLGFVSRIRFAASLAGTVAGRPFEKKILELYKLKQGEAGYAYKKILNSLYGKLCQVNRRFRRARYVSENQINDIRFNQDREVLVKAEEMRFSNFAYASAVTANVRLRIYDTLSQAPASVLACFTDSVISERELDIPLSKDLGDWELQKVDWLLLIGCGVYLYEKDGVLGGRFRGITLPKADDFLSLLRDADRGKIKFSSKRRFSFKQLSNMDDFAAENLILDCVRELDLNFDRKRIWEANFDDFESLATVQDSMPVIV